MAGISPTFGSASRTENLCPHRAHLAGSALPATVEERHFFDAICPRLTVKYILFCGLSFSVPPVFCIFRPSSKVVQRTYCPWQKSLSRLTPLRADWARCDRTRNAVPRSPRFFLRRPEAPRSMRLYRLSGSRSDILPAARSARTSSANWLRAAWEFENRLVHCSSSCSSSRSQSAMRSCSSGGSVPIFAITASRVRTMIRIVRAQGLRRNQAHFSRGRTGHLGFQFFVFRFRVWPLIAEWEGPLGRRGLRGFGPFPACGAGILGARG